MRKALGRGLDALIPGAGRGSTPEPASEATPSDVLVAIDKIHPNPRQPRVEFDEGALTDLVASVRAQGVLQPLLVRRTDDGDAPEAQAARQQHGTTATGPAIDPRQAATLSNPAAARRRLGGRLADRRTECEAQ